MRKLIIIIALLLPVLAISQKFNLYGGNWYFTGYTKVANGKFSIGTTLVTESMIANFNTAYSWGNHTGLYASLTGYNKTDWDATTTTVNNGVLFTNVSTDFTTFFTAWVKALPPYTDNAAAFAALGVDKWYRHTDMTFYLTYQPQP